RDGSGQGGKMGCRSGEREESVDQILERINTLAQVLLPFGKIRYIGYNYVVADDIPVFCSSNLSLDIAMHAIFPLYPDLEFTRGGGVRLDAAEDLFNPV